jgi:hypothetical protein
MTSLSELANRTKEEIKKLNKPLSAYQYYTKAMREKWKNLNDAEKEEYIYQAEHDKQRYEKEKEEIKEIEYNKISKLKIYLNRSYGRVPCVGLDNGFTSYEVVGPAIKVELFTEEEIEKLNLPVNNKKPKYKTIYMKHPLSTTHGYKFNKKAAKKYNVIVYGGNMHNSDSWYGLRENYEGKSGSYTIYTNYKGESWTRDH